MNEQAYRGWLQDNYKANTVNTKLSETRRVSQAYGDLDALYDGDRLETVLNSLKYTMQDRRDNRPDPSKLGLSGDFYHALVSYRNAVTYYKNFREGRSRRTASGRPDVEAIRKAMAEYDDMGHAAFCEAYDFGPQVELWIAHGGNRYPSKAIYGVAYQYVEGGVALTQADVRGKDARRHLIEMGFQIVDARNKRISEDMADEAYAARGYEAKRPALNKILYGPPGTGKTFETAREAVLICTGSVPEDREEVMAMYQSLHRQGRVRFVTFHQSFAYEEFVEGLRPDTDDSEDDDSSGGFNLVPHDGILKEMASLAAENRGTAISREAELDPGAEVFKMSLGRSRAADDQSIFTDAIEHGYVVLNYGGDVDWSDPAYERGGAIKSRWRKDHPEATGSDPNITQMYTFRVEMVPGSLVIVSDGNMKFRAIGQVTGPYQFQPSPTGEYNHRRPVRWLWHGASLPRQQVYEKVFRQASAYKLSEASVLWDGLRQLVQSGGDSGKTTGAPQPYVLIIDEINRANVSKVFGELITLLEPDKRLGSVNEVKVQLPYSREQFGLPANLHIVGTMNTADRSIALLDTALRRRFEFRELMPNPALLEGRVEGVPLSNFLNAINGRIEYLFDREHQIGHAYFFDCETREDVDDVMRHKVIPLLAEYFYEDWAKVALVLGDTGCVRFLDKTTLKAPKGMEDAADMPMRLRWSLKDRFSDDAYVEAQ
ncbi:AAA family ATPase [Achromobacter aloeverae]